MSKWPRKISLAQAVKQGDTVLMLRCVTHSKTQLRSGPLPFTCFHMGEVSIDLAIERYGAEASLSDIRGVCSVCGGREIDVTARGPNNHGDLPKPS